MSCGQRPSQTLGSVLVAVVAEGARIMTRLAFDSLGFCVNTVRESIVELVNRLSGKRLCSVVAQCPGRDHSDCFNRAELRQIRSVMTLSAEILCVARLALSFHHVKTRILFVILLEIDSCV